ncbi:MAG: hypothetical protein J6A02_11800 [Prevotella sp.]|nr:hypothetical protein [Prevotella sp.]
MNTEFDDITYEDYTGYSTTIDREDYFMRLLEKVCGVYYTDSIDYDVLEKTIYAAIDEQVENYSVEGKLYVDDWDVFDGELYNMAIDKLGLED